MAEFGFFLDTVGDRGNNKASVPKEIKTLNTCLESTESLTPFEKLAKFRDELLNDLKSPDAEEKQSKLIVFRDDQPAVKSTRKPEKKPKKQFIKTRNIADGLKKAAEEKPPRKLALEVQNVLKKAIVTPDFEQLKEIPPYDVSKRKLQQERKQEREKTKGKNWYGLPATEMTEEVKQDLEILQMRSVLDPKHFYKKNDLKVLPKYFQVGKVLDSPLEFYNNRLTNKERKKTLVDELLADAEFQQYNKRKYGEIMEEKQKTHYKSWRNAKKLKRKKK
ncbi:unnamed protein product [Ceutorhynchus assimilis]|uniref:Fcf2 pre-rRNA processing C-terminal domain-containing protein n=1 Tax=Ceutorhynchus assimilis TaxID=467358 RepID=A0A9N9MKZ2_9CUCU|nr:unnamed protein product [Ceutorhynchus assimilis]